MPTIKWWERKAKKLTLDQLKQLIVGLDTLKRWKPFEQEYKWTGLFTIKEILYAEYKTRKKPRNLQLSIKDHPLATRRIRMS